METRIRHGARKAASRTATTRNTRRHAATRVPSRKATRKTASLETVLHGVRLASAHLPGSATNNTQRAAKLVSASKRLFKVGSIGAFYSVPSALRLVSIITGIFRNATQFRRPKIRES